MVIAVLRWPQLRIAWSIASRRLERYTTNSRRDVMVIIKCTIKGDKVIE
jgi:hypothetical protein